ncbi:MAG: cryptochrome/photolyase family protein [Legionella sp.]|nr:cryptochrome/photolyase family protein [Legionella sp.]
MQSLRVILADQLSTSISSLEGLNTKFDTVLMCEVMEEATYVKHHKKKIAFLFSAMRHFAEMLRGEGISVRYINLDDSENTGSLRGEMQRAASTLNSDRIIITEPGEYRVLEMIKTWKKTYDIQR